MEVATYKALVSTLKNIDLNLAALPSEFLHTLQEGLITKIKAWEQHTQIMISEYKVNNEQMFAEKIVALEEWKKFQVQNEQNTVVVAEACRKIPELHIPEDVSLEAKIKKLATNVCDTKTEVATV